VEIGWRGGQCPVNSPEGGFWGGCSSGAAGAFFWVFSKIRTNQTPYLFLRCCCFHPPLECSHREQCVGVGGAAFFIFFSRGVEPRGFFFLSMSGSGWGGDNRFGRVFSTECKKGNVR